MPVVVTNATLAVAMILAAGSDAACSPVTAPATPPDARAAEAAVAHELDDFHEAAARADEPRYFAHFAPDAVFLGTDATERWNVTAFRAYAHPHFAAGKGWTYHPLRRSISVAPSGTFAWFDEDLLGERVGPTRGSGVLVLRDGRWLIALYDLSITVPNQRFDAVKAVLEAK
jgi:hypothetical protein